MLVSLFVSVAVAATSATAGARRTADSLVVDVDGRTTVLHAAEFDALARDSVRTHIHNDPPHTWAGVPMLAVLQRAGFRTDSIRGKAVSMRVVVECADGYRVVFGIGELAPGLGDRSVLVIDRQDGAPLPAADGPFRLIVPGDTRPTRWARQVVSVRVRRELP